jgi:hypothetical protein
VKSKPAERSQTLKAFVTEALQEAHVDEEHRALRRARMDGGLRQAAAVA